MHIWADAALRLEERDLRMMERLVRAQERSANGDEPVSNAKVVPLQAVGGVDD